jgi:hypothetical protein
VTTFAEAQGRIGRLAALDGEKFSPANACPCGENVHDEVDVASRKEGAALRHAQRLTPIAEQHRASLAAAVKSGLKIAAAATPLAITAPRGRPFLVLRHAQVAGRRDPGLHVFP